MKMKNGLLARFLFQYNYSSCAMYAGENFHSINSLFYHEKDFISFELFYSSGV